MSIKSNTNRNSDSLEQIVYRDAFSFIMGQFKDVGTLRKRHAQPQFRDIDTTQLYELAENTCRKVLADRKKAACTLAALIDARYALSHMAEPNQLSVMRDVIMDHKSQQEQVAQLVFDFVQARLPLTEVKTRFERILLHHKASYAVEKLLLECMEQARRDILLETAEMLQRCDLLQHLSSA